MFLRVDAFTIQIRSPQEKGEKKSSSLAFAKLKKPNCEILKCRRKKKKTWCDMEKTADKNKWNFGNRLTEINNELGLLVMIFIDIWWLLKEPFLIVWLWSTLLATGVLGYGFSSLAHSMLWQFTGQKKSHSRLDLARADCASLVVVSETGGFAGNSLEDIIYKGIHDAHGFAWDAGIWMNLSQNLVDVDWIAFPSSLSPLLFVTGCSLSAELLRFLCCFRSHNRNRFVNCERFFKNLKSFEVSGCCDSQKFENL